jgi:hypothetical protein
MRRDKPDPMSGLAITSINVGSNDDRDHRQSPFHISSSHLTTLFLPSLLYWSV